MPLEEEKIGVRGPISGHVPVDMTDREIGYSDFGKFRRDRGRRIGAGRTAERLARLFVGFALRQFSGRYALAETDFEEGPVLPGGVGGELRSRESAEDKLEHEHIGSEPAKRPPPTTQYVAPRSLHVRPTISTLAGTPAGPPCDLFPAIPLRRTPSRHTFSFVRSEKPARKAYCSLVGQEKICQGIRQ